MSSLIEKEFLSFFLFSVGDSYGS